jgi:hypothetical protein
MKFYLTTVLHDGLKNVDTILIYEKKRKALRCRLPTTRPVSNGIDGLGRADAVAKRLVVERALENGWMVPDNGGPSAPAE